MVMNIAFLSIQKKTCFLKENDDESSNNIVSIEKEILDSKEK